MQVIYTAGRCWSEVYLMETTDMTPVPIGPSDCTWIIPGTTDPNE